MLVLQFHNNAAKALNMDKNKNNFVLYADNEHFKALLTILVKTLLAPIVASLHFFEDLVFFNMSMLRLKFIAKT